MKDTMNTPERLTLCAQKLHASNLSQVGTNIIKTGVFSTEDLQEDGKMDKIKRQLKTYYLPKVVHAKKIGNDSTFESPNLSSKTEAEEYAMERILETPTKQTNRWLYSNYADRMCMAGYDVTAQGILACRNRVRKRKLRSENAPSSNKAVKQQNSALVPPRQTIGWKHTTIVPQTPKLQNAKQRPTMSPCPPRVEFCTPAVNYSSMPLVPIKQARPTQNQAELFTPYSIAYRLRDCVGCFMGMDKENLKYLHYLIGKACFQTGANYLGLLNQQQTGAMFVFNGVKVCLERNAEVDRNQITVRSSNCTYGARWYGVRRDRAMPLRCEYCEGAYCRIKKQFYRVQGSTESEVSKFTPIGVIKMNPSRAEERLRTMSLQLKKYKQQERLQELIDQRLESSGVQVQGKKAQALKAAFETITQFFDDKVKDGKMDPNDPKIILMKANLNNFQRYASNGAKRNRTDRFDPVLVSFCVQQCIKMGRRAYDPVAELFGWPTLRRVQQVKKDLAGKCSVSFDGVCIETINSMVDMAKAFKKGSNQRVVSLAFDSTMIREGVYCDINNDLTGIDITQPFSIVKSKFNEMAEQLGDKLNLDSLTGGLEENMANISKHHMVAIASCVDPSFKMSLVVGCINLGNLEAATLSNFLDSVVRYLHMADFDVCIQVGDGAKENVQLFEQWSWIPVSQYIPEEFQNEFQDIDFAAPKIGVRPHPCTGNPIIMVEDMPHLAKRVCHNLENSSIKTKQRDLRFGKKTQPMNLNMIKKVWEESNEGDKYRLPDTVLTYAHFEKDQLMRMRVALAVQVMSRRTHLMLDEATKEIPAEDFRKITGLYPTQYRYLMELIKHMDRLVDIINGKSKSGEKTPFQPSNGVEIQRELLTILQFFSSWKNANDKNEEMTKYNFLAGDTWKGMQRMILGYVVLIEVWVIGKGHTVHPRDTTSDVCEHYFCKGRASFGSTDGGTANDFNTHRRNQSALDLSMTSRRKSNNGEAPSR